MSLEPFLISLKLATVATIVLSLVCLPLIYWIHFYSFRLKPLFKAAISLPLVLPPTVLGYYLLVAFNPGSWLAQATGLSLAFSFPGLVLGAVIFSLPFMANPILSALEGLPDSYTDASYTLGKSSWQTYRKVLLPSIKPSLLAGAIMAFAHTIGEFGVVLMIGGSIPGETRVASIAIYQEVEALNYDTANFYSMILLVFSLSVLVVVYWRQQKGGTKT
ncbi:molybdate ABC transporter permease subunit [bacterium]|nr:molybdate ABC transporter permease subunit [bacterium]